VRHSNIESGKKRSLKERVIKKFKNTMFLTGSRADHSSPGRSSRGSSMKKKQHKPPLSRSSPGVDPDDSSDR
jgi:hypothetical protein